MSNDQIAVGDKRVSEIARLTIQLEIEKRAVDYWRTECNRRGVEIGSLHAAMAGLQDMEAEAVKARDGFLFECDTLRLQVKQADQRGDEAMQRAAKYRDLLMESAYNALQAYRYGNASPDLAEEIVLRIDADIALVEDYLFRGKP